MSRTVRRPARNGRKRKGRIRHACTCWLHGRKDEKKIANRKQRRKRIDEQN